MNPQNKGLAVLALSLAASQAVTFSPRDFGYQPPRGFRVHRGWGTSLRRGKRKPNAAEIRRAKHKATRQARRRNRARAR